MSGCTYSLESRRYQGTLKPRKQNKHGHREGTKDMVHLLCNWGLISVARKALSWTGIWDLSGSEMREEICALLSWDTPFPYLNHGHPTHSLTLGLCRPTWHSHENTEGWGASESGSQFQQFQTIAPQDKSTHWHVLSVQARVHLETVIRLSVGRTWFSISKHAFTLLHHFLSIIFSHWHYLPVHP